GDGKGHLPVWIQDLDGSVSVTTLGDLAETDLASSTVILPPSAEGLSKGMLTADASDAERKDYDVADEWRDEDDNRRRVRVWKDDPAYDAKTAGMRLLREIVLKNDEDEDAEGRSWHWYELPASADSEGSKTAKEPVTLRAHTKDV